MVDNPIELLIRSQQVALRLASDTIRTVTSAAVTGVTQPDELVRQVGDLANAVAGMAGAITGLAGEAAQPLQDFIVRQRELADTVAVLAEAQADLAAVVAKLAERHADAVTALEKVTAPVFTLVGTDPTPPKSRAARIRKSEVASAPGRSATAQADPGLEATATRSVKKAPAKKGPTTKAKKPGS